MPSFSADGWLEGAKRRPGPASKSSGPRPSTIGLVLHSAVGMESAMWSVLDEGRRGSDGKLIQEGSWTFSNMQDGRLFQHYPVGIRTNHAYGGNSKLIGMEQEGGGPPPSNYSEPLTEAQIDNCVLVAVALQEHYAWPELTRSGPAKNLWEHNEVQGSITECPSGRIPWASIIERARFGEAMKEDDMAVIITADGTRNYVTNFVQRRFIKSKEEREEMVRAGLPPTIYTVPQATLDAIPEVKS